VAIKNLMPSERIEQRIYLIRDEKVMLDSDLAKLYGVTTKEFNQAVKRNKERFPDDFMFRLTSAEFEDLRCHFDTSNLRSQFVTSKERGGRRYLPYVFTEQGVAMLSSVLRSKQAVAVNIEIIRTFVKLRRWIMTNKELAQQVNTLEKKYDSQFKMVFDAIRELMKPPSEKQKKQIGFTAREKV
jgi:leucyl aminopeptidase